MVFDNIKKVLGKKFKTSKKGVTPVIAVLLLLMMTVAAAGGAWVWMNELMEEFQEEGEGELDEMDAEVSILSMDCFSDSDEIDVYLHNSGGTALDLYPVDIDVYHSASGDLVAELRDMDLDQGDDSIEDPGDRGEYLWDIESDGNWIEGDELIRADEYEIEVSFPEGYELSGQCVAEES